MAKVIKGSRRVDKSDPTQRYAKYTGRGALIRRATHPEYYLHSWSQKVKKNRDIFAEAMVTYSKLDIVTKQAYTEAIRIMPILPPTNEVRKIYEKIRRKIDEWRQKYNIAVPIHILQHSPYYRTLIEPTLEISPETWEAYLRQIGVYKYYRRGHEQWIYDYIGWYENKDKEPQPFPNEVPLPQQELLKFLKGRVPVTTIVIEIEPSGLSGAVYNFYLDIQTEYHRVRRWVSAHKKEIIIVVVLGAFIWFGWEMILSGGLKLAGGEALVHEAVASPEVLAALGTLGIPFRTIKDYFHKKMVVGWAEDINLWAWNDTRNKPCYKEMITEDTAVMWNFYEGDTAENKGKLACWARLEVDTENQVGTLTWGCGESDERIILFKDGAEILRCNIGLTPYDIVDVWDNEGQQWLQSEVEYQDNKIIWHFYQGGLACGEIQAFAYPHASPIAWGIYVCWKNGVKYFSWTSTPYWDGSFHDVPCDEIRGYILEYIWPYPHWYLIVFTGHKGYFLDPANLPAWPGHCPEVRREAVTVIETLDENGQVKDITVTPHDYTGELFVYWRGMLIKYLPPKRS